MDKHRSSQMRAARQIKAGSKVMSAVAGKAKSFSAHIWFPACKSYKNLR
jgi:hypothetical protein